MHARAVTEKKRTLFVCVHFHLFLKVDFVIYDMRPSFASRLYIIRSHATYLG